jgi:two-component system KDP operon response regulator KdpE
MARVRAALRSGARPKEYGELEVGDVRMDTVARRVYVRDEEVTLTPTEFKLLHLLLCESGRVVTHRELLCQVWGPHCSDHVQYLRVFMRQLRTKIEQDAARPRRLVTVLGIGYRLSHY